MPEDEDINSRSSLYCFDGANKVFCEIIYCKYNLRHNFLDIYNHGPTTNSNETPLGRAYQIKSISNFSIFYMEARQQNND